MKLTQEQIEKTIFKKGVEHAQNDELRFLRRLEKARLIDFDELVKERIRELENQ